MVLGKNGPILDQYRLGSIETHVYSPIPRTTATKENKNNIRSTLALISQIPALPGLLALMRKIINKFDVSIIHMNHESLFFLGFLCKLLFDCRIIYHVRTMIPNNMWSKIQVYIAVKTADQLIFITENERNQWHSILEKSKLPKQKVIYNIAEQKNYEDCPQSISPCYTQNQLFIPLVSKTNFRTEGMVYGRDGFERCFFL